MSSRWIIGAVLATLCPQDCSDHWSGGYFPPLALLFDTCFVRFSAFPGSLMAEIYNIGHQIRAEHAYLRLQGWVEHFVPSLLSVFEMRFKSCRFIFLVSWYTDGRDLQYWSSSESRRCLQVSSRQVRALVPTIFPVFENRFKACRFNFQRLGETVMERRRDRGRESEGAENMHGGCSRHPESETRRDTETYLKGKTYSMHEL